jgi:hypothetical protein
MGLKEVERRDYHQRSAKRPGKKKSLFAIYQKPLKNLQHLQVPVYNVSDIKVIGVFTKWVQHDFGHIKPAQVEDELKQSKEGKHIVFTVLCEAKCLIMFDFGADVLAAKEQTRKE